MQKRLFNRRLRLFHLKVGFVSSYANFTLGYSHNTSGMQLTQWGGDMTGAIGICGYTWNGKKIINTDICILNTSWDNKLEETTLHEIGHAIGFDHNANSQSIMSYIGPTHPGINDPVGRRLTEDDIIGVSMAYPTSGYIAGRGTLKGTITDTSGNNINQAQIAIYDSSDLLVGTTLSENGTYEYKGLLPGNYSIRAFMSQEEGWIIQLASTLPFYPPSTFAYTDGFSAAVTAGSSTTQNILVNSGTPTMVLNYMHHTTNSSTDLHSHVFQLEKGSSANLGMDGKNLPQNSSQLKSLTLSGSGVTVSSPTFDDDSVSATFNVSPSASAGTRALILENSNNETIYINGFIEVYEKGTAAAAVGSTNPSSGSISGLENKVMAQIRLTAGSTEPVRLRKWTLTTGGTGATSEIQQIGIYHDANSDGALTSGEMLLGSGSISDGEIYSHHTIPAGNSQTFLIVYSFSNSLTESATYSTNLTELFVTGVNSGRALSPAGLPVNSNTHTVFNPVKVDFVVSSTSVTVPEGESASFTVRLSTQPEETVYVNVARTAGTPDIRITSPSTLTFTTSSWITPQAVHLESDEDEDVISKTADITLSTTAEIAPITVKAEAKDDAVLISIFYGKGGYATGGGSVDPDLGPFALEAVPYEDFIFSGWTTTNGTIASPNEAATTIDNLTANTTINAIFTNSNSAPTILQQPQGFSVGAGDTLEMSVSASTATGTLRYQWKRDNQAIPLAVTPRLIISPTKINDAGDYTCLVSNDQGSTESAPATITVSKKELTVSVDAISTTYGDADPDFSISFNGFIPGDDVSDLTGSPEFTVFPSPAVTSGTYTVSVSGLTGENYELTFIDGTYTITKAQLTVTANNTFRRPGDANPTFTSSATGLKSGDTLKSSGLRITYTTEAEDYSTTEGEFEVIPFGPPSTLNYIVNYLSGTLFISKDLAAVDIILHPGWNLLSLPLSTPKTTSDILVNSSSDPLNTGSLWKWDGQNGMYDELTESVPALDGFWAYSTTGGNAQTITGTDGAGTVSLYTGWNLVGVSTSTAVSSLPSSVVAIWKWNAEPQTYSQKISGDTLEPAEGYWFYLSQNNSLDL